MAFDQKGIVPDEQIMKALRQELATTQARIAELEALVGTVRGLIGCEVRNVRDIGVEQHSKEIVGRFAALEADRVRLDWLLASGINVEDSNDNRTYYVDREVIDAAMKQTD